MDASKVEIETCARAAHEANRAYCIALGDKSHEPWDAMADDQKRSARLGVIGILTKDFTPEQSHEVWVAEKIADGWQLGAKNVVTKHHPSLVAFSKLPPEEQIKDEIFFKVVRAVASALWRIPQ